MSEDNSNSQPVVNLGLLPEVPTTPQQPQEVLCMVCKKKWMFTSPSPKLNNFKGFSQAIWLHEQSVRCPHCAQPHVFVVGTIQIGWGLTAVRETQEEKKQIIVPPPGVRLT